MTTRRITDQMIRRAARLARETGCPVRVEPGAYTVLPAAPESAQPDPAQQRVNSCDEAFG